ncbi:YdcF family protein [Bacillus tianshenii]|nr:YdcF family protein [Bacillus tianshenii]
MKRKRVLIIPVILLLYILPVHIAIQGAAGNEPKKDAAYLIVLGAKVNGEQMSHVLTNRAKAAVAYLQENPDTKVIATGGQGKGEDITEAEAVSRYLIKQGIDEKRIIKEERSTSTYENLTFAKAFMKEEDNEVVIVSNDFHVYRALKIANRLDIEAEPLAAETPLIARPQLYVREYAAVAKSFLFDR